MLRRNSLCDNESDQSGSESEKNDLNSGGFSEQGSIADSEQFINYNRKPSEESEDD